MPKSRYKLNPFIRIISFILLISFVAQDIAWANPDILSEYNNSDSLAPESFIRNPESPSRAAAKFIEYAIEANPSVSKSSIMVEGIEAILRHHAGWLAENGIRYEVSRSYNKALKNKEAIEILIIFPGENLVLRYYDPSLLPIKEGYEVRETSHLGVVDKQVLVKAGGTAVEKPREDKGFTAIQVRRQPAPELAPARNAVERYRSRMQVLTNTGRHIEAQRLGYEKIRGRWYLYLRMKNDALDKQEKKIRRSLGHLEKIFDELARIRPACSPGADADNAERLEYIKLGMREIEIRLSSMIGRGGELEMYKEVSERLKDTALLGITAFFRDRRRLPNFERYAAILKGISMSSRDSGGEIHDLHPGHRIEFNTRIKLYKIGERFSEIGNEAARLNLRQTEFNLGPRIPQDRMPEGRAAEAEKMEKAATIGLMAAPFLILVPIFHQSLFSALLTVSYVIIMMIVPIYTARSMNRALAFEKLKKQPWLVRKLQGMVDRLVHPNGSGNDGVYGLIWPFEGAKDIKELYVHDPDSRGKLSYYSFSMEEPGKPRQAMSQLYIDKQAMVYVPRFVQWVLYLHEWLHGRVRIRTEQLNVPLTYNLPWIAFCLVLLPFIDNANLGDFNVDLSILLYNIAVLIAARTFAAIMPGKVSIAGHWLLNAEQWKHLTDFDIDNIVIDHAHNKARDPVTGNMASVREWVKGASGDVAELVRCDPNRPEDILVIKANYVPASDSRIINGQQLKSSDVKAVEDAIRPSGKNYFRVIIAVSDEKLLPLNKAAGYRSVEATMKEVKLAIRRQYPGARIRFSIRSTDCDLTRLTDLKKFYHRRQERIVKSLLETEAVACEVHGNIKRLKKLLDWLLGNKYRHLVLLGDYLSKKDYGFEAIDILMDHVKSGRGPKLTMLIGKSEFAFLLAMLGDEKWMKMWPGSKVMEGPAVIESLKNLGNMAITADMPKRLKYDIRQAADFQNMVERFQAEGKGGWEKWYRFHPKLLQIADFIINNMDISAEDDHHNIYTTGPRSSVEEFEWRGLTGVEALFEMDRDFKEHAKARLRILKIIEEICAIAGLGTGANIPQEASIGIENKFAYIETRIVSLIAEEERRNTVFGKEIVPKNTLESLASTSRAAIDSGSIDSLIDVMLTTLRETEGPMADIYSNTIFEKLADTDFLNPVTPTPEYRRASREKQLRLVGVNTTINLSKLREGILNTEAWPEGRSKHFSGTWPKNDQDLSFFRIFDSEGMKLLGVDSLGTDNPEEYLVMTARTADEEPSGVGTGMSIESTTKEKLDIINGILGGYKELIGLTDESPFRRILEDIRHQLFSPIFFARKATVIQRPEIPVETEERPKFAGDVPEEAVNQADAIDTIRIKGQNGAVPDMVAPSAVASILPDPLAIFPVEKIAKQFSAEQNMFTVTEKPFIFMNHENPFKFDKAIIDSLRIFSLQKDGEPVGSLTIAIVGRQAYMQPYLEEGFRGAGIGSFWLDEMLIPYLRAHNVDKVTVFWTCWSDKIGAYNSFLSKRGFKISRSFYMYWDAILFQAVKIIATPDARVISDSPLSDRGADSGGVIEMRPAVPMRTETASDMAQGVELAEPLSTIKSSAVMNSTSTPEMRTIIVDRVTMVKFHDWSTKMKMHLYRMLHLMEKIAAAESGGERMVAYKDLKACYIKAESTCNSIHTIGLPEEIFIGMMHDLAQVLTVVGLIPQKEMFSQAMAQDDVLNNEMFNMVYGGVKEMIRMESLASRVHGTFVMIHEPLNDRWKIDLKKSAEAAPPQKDMDTSSRQFASSVLPARDVVQPFAVADSECRIDLETRPMADDERILLSESLFMDGADRQELDKIILALAPILNKPGSHIEILKEEDIVRHLRIINGKSSKDKTAVVLSQEDLNKNPYWKNPGTTESIKATVLFAGTKLTGANYLYLTGLIGFTRAVMAENRDKVAMYYKLLTGDDIKGDILKLLDIAGSNNTIPFALKLIFKFRPIEKIDPAKFEASRIAMENFLISA